MRETRNAEIILVEKLPESSHFEDKDADRRISYKTALGIYVVNEKWMELAQIQVLHVLLDSQCLQLHAYQSGLKAVRIQISMF
jgi:hypothetical protein